MDHHEILKRALNSHVAEVVPVPTPLEHAPRLSERLGRPVFLKREDLTPIFSFKLRGAHNRIAMLDEGERARGVIAASAGNHAQGVAYAAARLGLVARVVMPRTTPAIKVEAVRRLGARVDLIGDEYSEAAAHCLELAAATGMTLIPPYDDPDVICGQATIGLEILRQASPAPVAVFVPVGGGGLASGIAAVIKALRPDIKVIGVEPCDSDAMRQSLIAGRIVTLDHVGIFADGVAVRRVGDLTFDLCRRHLDDCIAVEIDEICAAIKDVFEDTRSVLEPAGALAVAGLKRAIAQHSIPVGAAVAIASGANINFNRLGYVAESAAVGEHREAILAAAISERPGAFLEFLSALGPRNITEFNYRLDSRVQAQVFAGIEIEGCEEGHRIERLLRERGIECHDLTDNDIAKTHLRHMVGGRSAEVRDEIILSFEFPERPGALLKFLSALGSRWNISLFHYRNNGGAYGRVLCGLEAPPAARDELHNRLREVGFAYMDETANPAVRLFLR